jgi:general stress protein YciG
MTISAGKQRRGFASMSSEKQREIASKGGRAAHVKGTAHEWTPDEARSAGRKGARASRDGRGRTAISAESTPESRPAMSGPAMSSEVTSSEVTMDSENVS